MERMIAKLVGILATVMIVAAVAVFATTVITLVVAAYGADRGGRALWRRRNRGVELRAHQRAELLARAELQHRWWLEGDPRGTYGRYTPAGRP